MSAEQYRAYAAQLVRNPDDAEALVNQYAVISKRVQDSALHLCMAKRAYELAPDQISPLFNYGSALHRAGHFKPALDVYLRCEKIAPGDWSAKVLHHIGVAYRSLGLNRKAADYYMRAYVLDASPFILRDRALAILADGDLYEGLKAFEARRAAAELTASQNGGHLVAQARLPAGVVHWEGQDLTGKSVVVYHEEGSGDFIQFCRFIPLLKVRGAKSVHICGPVDNLLELVADNIAVDGIVPLSGPFECDFVVGSLSLPWRCGVTMGDVSGAAYFRADAASIPKRGSLNVGLVWRGNPAYGQDVHRSMPFSAFCPLLEMPGVAFYSLQAGPAGLEVTEAGFDGFVANLEPLAQSWRDTARLIQALDVVVTVDTAVAHLAGALGKPVLILTTAACDWRWDRSSQRSVWYESARVIRQKQQDDWSPCIDEAKRQIRRMMDRKPGVVLAGLEKAS